MLNRQPAAKLRSRKARSSMIGSGRVSTRQKKTTALRPQSSASRAMSGSSSQRQRGQPPPIEAAQQGQVRPVDIEGQPDGAADDQADRQVDQEQPVPGQHLG